MNKPKILTIVGPTGSGKTDLSYKLAEYIEKNSGKSVEIISADSRQIYKHIPIATAQPSAEEQRRYKHYFVNEIELESEFNAGEFGAKARDIIANILKEDKIPMVVGGSGLYLSSLIYGLFESEVNEQSSEKKKEVRAKLYERLEKEGKMSLLAELKKVDEVTHSEMENVTERRVIRALEMYQLTGVPISVHRSRKIEIEYEFVQYMLQWERAELYNRINNRVDKMVESGLIKEITALKDRGLHYSTLNSLNTVGVREVFDYLDGKITHEKMAELIKQNSRRYAKRQLTWFRRDENIKSLNPDGFSIGEIVNWWTGEINHIL